MLKRFYNKFLKNQKGLTLVELLAVVVILGIISAIATVSIGNVIQRSREDAVHADAILILSAAELFVAQGGDISSNTVGSAQIGEFLASEGSFEGITWEVNRATGANGELTITAPSVPAGEITISFDGASLSQINQSREDRADNAGVSSTGTTRTRTATPPLGE